MRQPDPIGCAAPLNATRTLVLFRLTLTYMVGYSEALRFSSSQSPRSLATSSSG